MDTGNTSADMKWACGPGNTPLCLPYSLIHVSTSHGLSSGQENNSNQRQSQSSWGKKHTNKWVWSLTVVTKACRQDRNMYRQRKRDAKMPGGLWATPQTVQELNPTDRRLTSETPVLWTGLDRRNSSHWTRRAAVISEYGKKEERCQLPRQGPVREWGSLCLSVTQSIESGGRCRGGGGQQSKISKTPPQPLESQSPHGIQRRAFQIFLLLLFLSTKRWLVA